MSKLPITIRHPQVGLYSTTKLRVISNPRDRISTSFQGLNNDITYVKPNLRTILIDRYPAAAPTAVVTVTWPYGSDLWSYLERIETINPIIFLGRDSGFSGIFNSYSARHPTPEVWYLQPPKHTIPSKHQSSGGICMYRVEMF